MPCRAVRAHAYSKHRPFTPRATHRGRLHAPGGLFVLSTDKLATGIPREASSRFGAAMMPFVPQLALLDGPALLSWVWGGEVGVVVAVSVVDVV